MRGMINPYKSFVGKCMEEGSSKAYVEMRIILKRVFKKKGRNDVIYLWQYSVQWTGVNTVSIKFRKCPVKRFIGFSRMTKAMELFIHFVSFYLCQWNVRIIRISDNCTPPEFLSCSRSKSVHFNGLITPITRGYSENSSRAMQDFRFSQRRLVPVAARSKA